MKMGIIGLEGVGKATIFEALTQNAVLGGTRDQDCIGTIRVPDKRVEILSEMYQPKKTIYAQVEYFLPGAKGHGNDPQKDHSFWTPVRDCDALIHVVRNFGGYGYENPTPAVDFQRLDQDLILADLVVVEKRIERIELDKRRGKSVDPEEAARLAECLEYLENEIPLRKFPELASAPVLRGFSFVSGKPMLVLFNNEDDDDAIPDAGAMIDQESCMVIRGKLEQELAQMSDADAAEFLAEFEITASAMDRVILKSYDILGLVSFFTVGEDEVRAWTIAHDTQALDAAEVIHSDIKKGFIRAEVLYYDDLVAAKTYKEARSRGTVRLEGKTYLVKDGDIINFRFNV